MPGSVARRQGECGRVTRACGRAAVQAGGVGKTAACRRSLLTSGRAKITKAPSKSQPEDGCSSGGGTQPPAGLARPMFTDVLKIKRCVIVTGQGDTKDFSKERMGTHGAVQPLAGILYSHEGRSDPCSNAGGPRGHNAQWQGPHTTGLVSSDPWRQEVVQ